MSEPPVTDHEMAEAMITYGGGFVSRLGHLWLVADEVNRATLLAAFPHYCDEYRDLARRKKAREQ